MHVTQWKEPALSWNGTIPEHGRAGILEIRSDDFLPQFLLAMGGKDPGAYFDRHNLEMKGSAPLKLYQPLHGCFYLVTASLVCRQLGLPDKAIDRSSGESVFFVIRRRPAGGGEEAWIQLDKGGYWKKLEAGETLTVAEGEERLPMHPVKICPKPDSPRSVYTDNIERELHYGYIPTGNRDKYKDTLGRTLAADIPPEQLVDDFFSNAEASIPPVNGKKFSFRYEMFYRRIYLPWSQLKDNLLPTGSVRLRRLVLATNAQTEQLYALLELGDFIKNSLPTLWAAIEAGNGSDLPAGTKDFFRKLTDDTHPQALLVKKDGSDIPLGEVMVQYKSHFELIRGQGNIPATNFDFREFLDVNSPPDPATNRLNTLNDGIEDAISEETQPIQIAGGEDNELVQLITQQVQPRETGGKEPLYHIRAVYEYDPECPPEVSALPSHPFQLTKFFEPDAPARLVRLEAPSIKPQDLRKYARGVGIEMSPELHKLASCISGGDIEGIVDSVAGTCNDGWSIQMVCTFSIQIIFMVAFIVMFIFLILLNFVFWWLPFLRICLPIPTKESSP